MSIFSKFFKKKAQAQEPKALPAPVDPFDVFSRWNRAAQALNEVFEEPDVQAMFKDLGHSLEAIPLAAAPDVSSAPIEIQLDAKTRERGSVGTKIDGGIPNIERNNNLKPRRARGNSGRDGVLEANYRRSPVNFKNYNELKALIIGAEFSPELHPECDDETKEIALQFDLALKRMKGGPTGRGDGYASAISNACTSIRKGFAAFMTQWVQDENGDWWPYALNFREQSTLQRWNLDPKNRKLYSAEFYSQYTDDFELRCGETPYTAQLAVVSMFAEGLNFEGISPIRVNYGLQELKLSILKSMGVGVQKYSAPIAKIKQALEQVSAADLTAVGSAPDYESVNALMGAVANQRAGMAPVVAIPAGLDLQYETPAATMPDYIAILNYLDQMMALAWSNEGALLGSAGFGSYSMAAVSENKFLRSAPIYAREISNMFTELLWLVIGWNHSDPDSIQHMPRYKASFDATQDASKWLADLTAVIASGVLEQYPELRPVIAKQLGVAPEVLEREIEASPELATEAVEAIETVFEPGRINAERAPDGMGERGEN